MHVRADVVLKAPSRLRDGHAARAPGSGRIPRSRDVLPGGNAYERCPFFTLMPLLLPSLAFAQLGTCSLTWQVSLDQGTTWRDGTVRVGTSVPEVRIRALLASSQDAGYALDITSFDAVVRSTSQVAWNDQVVAPRIPWPFDSRFLQTIVATRFGREIKIDEVRDTLPPGQGTRAITASQFPQESGFPFTRDNPVSVFECALTLDGREGEREIDLIFLITPSGGSGEPRFYRGPLFSDGFNRPAVTVNPLTLDVVVPAPGWGAVAMGAFLGVARRRRSR